MNKSYEKLGVKDLVTTGIFTAVYFVLFLIATATGYIPIMVFAYPVITALLAGIPIILFFAKINKFGMTTILSILIGLFMLMGFGPIPCAVSIACGIIADLILKAGQYKSWKHMLAAYIVFSIWSVSGLIPIFMMGEAYFDSYFETMGEAAANSAVQLMTDWMIPVIFGLTAAAAVLGAFLGKAVLKKHFKRAGIL